MAQEAPVLAPQPFRGFFLIHDPGLFPTEVTADGRRNQLRPKLAVKFCIIAVEMADDQLRRSKVERYRERARACREKAEQVTDLDKAQWLALATDWEQLIRYHVEVLPKLTRAIEHTDQLPEQ